MQKPDRKSFLISALLFLAILLVGALYLGDLILLAGWCSKWERINVRIFSGVAAIVLYFGLGHWVLSGTE